jgi:glutamyl/glutaminyl-tRNA synthetase
MVPYIKKDDAYTCAENPRKIHKYRRIRMTYIKKDDAYMCRESKKNTEVQKNKDAIHKVYFGIPA